MSSQGAEIKIEVNLVGRGIISEPVTMVLCDKAQDEFKAFVEMTIVPLGTAGQGNT